MVDAYYKDEQSSAEELDKVCGLLAWLSVHADEDMPSEYRTKHFRNALDEAVGYLEDSGWYEFNKNKCLKESKDDNT